MSSTSPNLLGSLINAAEKASNIARICRSNKQLLNLLVQEKTGSEANARFQHDFKTLADVLIQETIKHDVGLLFPEIQEAIKGEESPNFTNKDGITVLINVGETEIETLQYLNDIIDDAEYQEAMQLLASEIHRNIEFNDLGNIPDLPTNINYSDLGIWIDPIDGTAEYICADNKPSNFVDIVASGLDCVTVLIGVYERSSGIPVIGVISQPFHKISEKSSYKSQIFWGVALGEFKANNISQSSKSSNRHKLLAICSSSEQHTVLEKLEENGFDIVFSAGAGHKALKIITNHADMYILSKGSTFKWDTCAPQAILRSFNGDMFDYVESIKKQTPVSIKYLQKDTSGDSYDEKNGKCNLGGVIAVCNTEILNNILSFLNSV